MSEWLRLATWGLLCGVWLGADSTIEPPNIHLAGPGSAQTTIVPPGCELLSRDPSIVAIRGRQVVGRAPGTASVELRCGTDSRAAAVSVGSKAVDMTVSLAGDLLSIFTTKGCNGSACHGSPAGQNGFKLSLFGSDPAADREMIVEMHEGRRVDLAQPENSLLLKKPTFEIPHGGGQLFTAESDAYRMILDWLKQGARESSAGARLESLEMYPRERILVGAGVRRPLAVIGRLSDGSTQDMTGQVSFSTVDEAVVSAVSDAEVVSKGRGLTTVMARAMGKVATSQFIVIDEAAESGITPDPANFIDRRIFATLQRVNVRPFSATSDRAFVRRVYLDAIGMLPTVAETEAFVSDRNPEKRMRLIDELLEREEYATQWLVKFEDWFRNSQYYSQGRTNGSYKRWLLDLIRHDRPYDEAVREMLTAVGDTTVRPAGNFWHPAMDFMLRTFSVSKATPTVARLFLGKRIECAECHNHPLENLTQDDFYGMAAFLGRMKVKHGYGQYRRVWYNTREGEVLHPVTKEPVAPKFLEGERPEMADGADRRTVLANWITRDQQMQFARATVNRVWYEYFGRGIVEPFDDFRSTNRPTHPELLDELAEHFIDSGFRFKALHRLILNSKTYQLSAHEPGRPGGEDPLEDLLYARYVPRKLPAEVLLDAIGQVTQVPETFSSYPKGTSSKELIASIGAPYFLTTFGFPRRDVMETRSRTPSLSQALHLMNSDTVREKVSSEDNVLGRLLAEGLEDDQIVERLYQRAYARSPTPEQSGRLLEYVQAESAAGRSRRRALENVLWTVLNSKEFQLNR